MSHKFKVSSFRNTISYQLVWFDRTKTVKTIDLCQWMSLFVLHKSKPKFHSQSIYVNVNRIAKCATLIRTYMATLRNYRIYTHHFALSVRRFYIDFNQMSVKSYTKFDVSLSIHKTDIEFMCSRGRWCQPMSTTHKHKYTSKFGSNEPPKINQHLLTISALNNDNKLLMFYKSVKSWTEKQRKWISECAAYVLCELKKFPSLSNPFR